MNAHVDERPYVRFRDRFEAGAALGRALRDLAGRQDLLVLGLARGGVPVAARVAAGLGAPLDVLVVRKLGVPWEPELAMGAIASGGVITLNRDVLDSFRLGQAHVERVVALERVELERRELAYRHGRAPANPAGRLVILVDDGLATGSSMESAIAAVRARKPLAVVVAVPVAPVETCERLEPTVERLVCLSKPPDFKGVGDWYDDFSPMTDAEVRRLLSEHEPRIS